MGPACRNGSALDDNASSRNPFGYAPSAWEILSRGDGNNFMILTASGLQETIRGACAGITEKGRHNSYQIQFPDAPKLRSTDKVDPNGSQPPVSTPSLCLLPSLCWDPCASVAPRSSDKASASVKRRLFCMVPLGNVGADLAVETTGLVEELAMHHNAAWAELVM